MSKLTEISDKSTVTASEVEEITERFSHVLDDTVSTINSLISGVHNTISGISEISSLSSNSDNAKGAIVDSMDSLSAISEENAASMEELDATISILSSSASDLKAVSDALSDALQFFKL